MNQQLLFSVQANNTATLNDFNWERNGLLQQQLQNMLRFKNNRLLYLWGPRGSGKSHLLQACCQEASQASAIYLPLQMLKEWGPESLEALEDQNLVCIDDLDAVSGDKAWEEALLYLYNRIRDLEQCLLILSGKEAPTGMPIQLADLKSRLAWGLVMQLNELSDEGKISTLKLHAQKRGFDLPESVAQFLITRCSRKMHDLHQLLNRLDNASLATHRKITIPFVKAILGL